jgi:capsular exopolysaccharide synthesis family protein
VTYRAEPGDRVDLRDFVRVLRRRWRIVAAFFVLATVAAATGTALSTRIYRADAEVFVSLRDGGSSTTSNAYQGNLFSQERVKSYAKIADSPAVTRAVLRQLGLDLTPQQLAGKVKATAPTDTVLVDITVDDPSPERAQQLANAVAAQFAKVVGDLERPAAGRPSPVSVTVVRPAEVPDSPISPRVTIDIALGLLVGLALGIGAAVLRETLDTTVKTAEDVQKLTGSSPLGVIGYDPRAQNSPLVSQMASRTGRGEAFRTLRTNLRYVDVDHPPRVVVVTSSVAGEGKSTTACNLAIALAGVGTSVLLVEGDLRRPRIADYMGLEGAVGLTDVLVGRAGLDEVLQPWSSSRLAVLPSGALPPNPSELLSSVHMTELIAALRSRAEVVIIDAPPLLPVTDAAVIARECDGAMVIVRHGKTTREQLARSLDALNSIGARVLGSVFNMVPTSGPNSYGYGYYQGEYHSRTDRPKLVTVDGLAETQDATPERSRGSHSRVG